MKKIIVVLLILTCLCSGLLGCNNRRTTEADTASETTVEIVETETTEEVVRYTHQIVYEDIQFYSEEEMQAWRQYLLPLIENQAIQLDHNGLDAYYEYPYPERPGISYGWDMGLFDFDMNGIPELLVNLGGGSSGNTEYEVYDIQTGQCVGDIGGGMYDNWCFYFNRVSGQYQCIGQYNHRDGFYGRYSFISKIILRDPEYYTEDLVESTRYLWTYYSINMERLPANENDLKSGYDATYIERCDGVMFFINYESVTIDEYISEYNAFVMNNVRISDTVMQLIDPDDYTTAAEVVDALLSSGQKFIVKDE